MNIFRLLPPLYVPNFLYKYTSVDRALEVLQTGQVYFTHRRELNDPFDGKQATDLSNRESRKELIKLSNRKIKEQESQGRDLNHLLSGTAREEYQKRFIEDDKFANNIMQQHEEDTDKSNTGVYCFSEKEDSIIMWTHYANNHQGCCLEFNFQEHICRYREDGKYCFPFSLISMIRYCDKYPVHVFGSRKEYFSYPLKSRHLTKSKDWQYEKEWRAIMVDAERLLSGQNIDSDTMDEFIIKRMKGLGHYLLDTNLLHGIILGCQMKDDEKQSIINAALSCGIKIYQAQPKLYEYGMEIKLLSNFTLAK